MEDKSTRRKGEDDDKSDGNEKDLLNNRVPSCSKCSHSLPSTGQRRRLRESLEKSIMRRTNLKKLKSLNRNPFSNQKQIEVVVISSDSENDFEENEENKIENKVNTTENEVIVLSSDSENDFEENEGNTIEIEVIVASSDSEINFKKNEEKEVEITEIVLSSDSDDKTINDFTSELVRDSDYDVILDSDWESVSNSGFKSVSNCDPEPVSESEIEQIFDSDSESEVVNNESEESIMEINDEGSYDKENIFSTNNNIEKSTKRENEEIKVFNDQTNMSNCDLMKKYAKTIEHDDILEFQKNYNQTQNQINNDPILKKYLKYELSPVVPYMFNQMQSIRLHSHIEATMKLRKKTKNKSKEQVLIEINKALHNFAINYRYKPPKSRIQILSNISSDPKNCIPVYSELPNETLSNLILPKTMNFEYLNQNIYGDVSIEFLCDKIKTLYVEAEKEENLIVCNCSDDPNNLVRCSENPSCSCYQMNLKFQKLQKLDLFRKEITEFKTFGKVFLRDIDHYFDTFAFICGEKCKCHGKCDNNIMLTIENRIHKAELYRYDVKGFGVRAMSYIPFGTPVFEFTGEILDHNSIIKNKSNDYAFELFNFEKNDETKETIIRNFILKNIKNKNNEYYKILENILEFRWYLDPKRKGNESRFVTHGCQPNLAMVRVFRHGFAPHQTKCLMISLEDIFPGTQLTFDYGDKYVQVQLGNKCLCSTIGCVNIREASILASAKFENFSKFHEFRYHQQKREYQTHILEKKNPTQRQRKRRFVED